MFHLQTFWGHRTAFIRTEETRKVSSVPVTLKEFYFEADVILLKIHLRKKLCPAETKEETEIISTNTEVWNFSIAH